MSQSFLPYGRHQIDDDDIEAVVSVLKSGALTCGPKIEEFEAAFSRKIGVNEAVVCSNGTTALHMAVMAAGIGAGDNVVVPSVTFLSTANAVRMVGGNVVFADVCAETGLLTLHSLQEAVLRADGPVKAAMPVHLNGQCADMEKISAFCESNGITIITDCCHALGAEYTDEAGGHPGDGRFEHMGCFSLHPVKSIAMGEGGFVTTASAELARKLRSLRSHGMVRTPDFWEAKESAVDPQSGEPNPWYYEMQELGYNYRATDIQCALGLSQLAKLDGFIKRRREIAELYDRLLRGVSNAIIPVPRTNLAHSSWHLYPVMFDFEQIGLTRAAVMKALAEQGVGTQVHYIPVSSQPYYSKLYGEQVFPGAESYYGRVLSLPIFPAMTDEDVQRVVKTIKSVVQ